jgi:hypothetical protein
MSGNIGKIIYSVKLIEELREVSGGKAKLKAERNEKAATLGIFFAFYLCILFTSFLYFSEP